MNGAATVTAQTLGLLYNPATGAVSALLLSPSVPAPWTPPSTQTKISDYGQLQEVLATLQSAAQSLSGDSAFSFGASSVDPQGVVSANAPGSAAGSYAVRVTQLAQGETLLSAPQASADALLGSGAATTFTFQFAGGATASVSVGSGNNSLNGIAAAINAANAGVTAGVASNGSTDQLVLSGPAGADNAFTVAVSGDATLSQLFSYPSGGGGLTLAAQAQDAFGSINGVPFSSPDNAVNAAGGLALSLNATGTASVTVSPDATQALLDAQALVSAYNAAIALMAAQGSGALAGDPTLPALQSQLYDLVTAPSAAGSGPYTSLAQVGFSVGADNRLTFDPAVFQSAFAANPAAVMALFTNASGSGAADQLSALALSYIAPHGVIANVMAGLQQQQVSVSAAAAGAFNPFAPLAQNGLASSLLAQYNLVSAL